MTNLLRVLKDKRVAGGVAFVVLVGVAFAVLTNPFGGEGTAAASEASGPVPTVMSAWIGQQLDADKTEMLADGKVTRDEYLAAANDAVACIKALGYPVQGPTWGTDERLHYTVGPTASRNPPGVAECYDENLDGIADAWANGLAMN